ncbi:hypothetical protein [Paenibacillus sp. SYP-B4298]|uniref:hypothetical protein n=1 Tax=Paenibacillus sp. SYP-B4298 TaxID=2996034 RepID=UPI0022DE7389|nr:hypothetical protein [Paenibacillus sp. SYP-B4298]
MNSSTPPEASPTIDSQRPSKRADVYVSFVRHLFVSPDTSVQQALSYRTYIPGLFSALLAAVIFALISLIYANQLAGWIGMLSGNIFSLMSQSVNYVSVFAKVLALVMVQWALLSAMLLGGARLFKAILLPVQAFNAVGVSKVYLAAAGLCALLLSFVHSGLAISVFMGGFILSVSVVIRSVGLLAPQSSFYFVPTVFAAYYVALSIVMSILF